MSYVFQGVNSLLNDDENQQQQSSNIFAPTEGAPGGSGESLPGQQAQKTSTEGELGGAGPASGAMGSEGKPQAQGQSADARLMQRNKVKAPPKFAEKAQGDLADAQNNLQNEANAYTQQAAGKSYAIGNEEIDKAVGGDEGASTNVRGLLTGTADRAQSFAPETDYDVDDIYRMQTDAGLDSILRRDAGAEYTSGEAAFDRSLLNRSADFNQLRSMLKAGQENLVKQADEWSGSSGTKTQEAQGSYDKNYQTAVDAASGYLGSQGDSLRADQDSEAKAENEARAALRKGDNGKFIGAEAQKAMAKLIADYEGTDPAGVLKYIRAGLIDPAKYLKLSDDVTWEQGIDEAEAKKFNSIMGLLGRTDSWSKGSGFGDRQSFDSSGFSSDLERAADRANTSADQTAQADIDRLLAAADSRLANTQAERKKLESGGLLSDFSGQQKGVLDRMIAEYGIDKVKDLMEGGSGYIDPRYYQTINQVSGGRDDFLDAQSVKALNAALDELGDKGKRYKVGKMGGAKGTFDAKAYEQAIRAMLVGTPEEKMSVTAKIGQGSQQIFGKGGAIDQVTSTLDTLPVAGRNVGKISKSVRWN